MKNSHGGTINGVLISWSFMNTKKTKNKMTKEMFWLHSIICVFFLLPKISDCGYWTFWNVWCHRIISNEPLYIVHNKNSGTLNSQRCTAIQSIHNSEIGHWTLGAGNILLAVQWIEGEKCVYVNLSTNFRQLIRLPFLLVFFFLFLSCRWFPCHACTTIINEHAVYTHNLFYRLI